MLWQKRRWRIRSLNLMLIFNAALLRSLRGFASLRSLRSRCARVARSTPSAPRVRGRYQISVSVNSQLVLFLLLLIIQDCKIKSNEIYETRGAEGVESRAKRETHRPQRRGTYIKSALIPNCLCPCMPTFVFVFDPCMGIIISGFCLIF